MKMTSLIDYILSLFRSEDAARSFVAAPGRAMTSAGLIDIAPHQISSVAANVVPGLNLGAGDPMSGLRQAVAARHGFAQDVANVASPVTRARGWQASSRPMSVRAWLADWVLGSWVRVAWLSPRQAVVSAVRSAWLPRSVWVLLP